MNLILFDNAEVRANLLPLTFTRPIADLRVGITTIREKWQEMLHAESSSSLTEEYLSVKFPMKTEDGDGNLFVAGHVIPTPALAGAVASLAPGHALTAGDIMVAYRGTSEGFKAVESAPRSEFGDEVTTLAHLYDIFGLNGRMIADDYTRLDLSDGAEVPDTNTVIGPRTDAEGRSLIYIASGAKIEGATINTKGGPVYIGPDAEVMEGSCLRGPLALCRHSTVNMGSKIYGSTTIGPWSKVGGELNNVVIIGFSNKAHDGFLGNAVIGEWCNLGAGCVASNLKNDYTPIKLWNYPAHRFLKTGLQFCGLIMGDHSKAGINTMFNTATVVGVGVNVHGAGFPRNFIASFSEGGTSGFSDVQLSKFFDIAERVMARRGVTLTDTDREIFERIYAIADTYK